MHVRVDVADQVGPLVGAAERDGARPLAHGKAIDRCHADLSSAITLQARFDHFQQGPAWAVGNIVLLALLPTRDADEDLRRHGDTGWCADFGANLGQRRPIAMPTEAHNMPCTTSERAANCAATSAGTLLSKACVCGAPMTCGASN